MTEISIRRLQPHDSLDELTALLHRAFSPLARQGFSCRAATQSIEATRARIERGDCLLAIVDRRIVGTATLCCADRHSPIQFYRDPTVASLHQLAVDPSRQGIGVGSALLRAGEVWARIRRFAALALDTPDGAGELRMFYARHGFRWVGSLQLATRDYRSAVMSKPLVFGTGTPTHYAWPPRHPAEMDLVSRGLAWPMAA